MTYLVSLLLSLPLIGAYAILAVGIVMIYRASKVLNLAHGAMVMVPPFVVYSLTQGDLPPVAAGLFGLGVLWGVATTVRSRLERKIDARAGRFLSLVAGLFAGVLTFLAFQIRMPVPLAVVIGIGAGAGLGWGVERAFIRPLRRESETAQTVGTVAALGLLVAIAARIWGTTPLPSVKVFPEGFIEVGLSSISYGQLMLFAVMLVVTAALIILFQRTDIGMVMRGTAENRRAAALMGVDPDRVTGLAWVMGGALAGLAGIMLASITQLHPYTLSLQALPAFIAALIAGLLSLPGALLGSAIVGATQGLVPALGPLSGIGGAEQLFLALVAIVVMAFKGGGLAGADPGQRGVDVTPAGKARSAADTISINRGARRGWSLAFLLVVLIVPLFVPEGVIASANLAAQYAVIAASLVLLTGWVGQISLGQAALVGVGAYMTGHFAAGFGIPFPLNLPLAAASGAVMAGLLGIVAVRVRGLYLAVATLIFSWMASEFLFRQDWFIGHSSITGRPIGGPDTIPFFNFTDRRTFYYVAWAVTAFIFYLVANMRDSKTGRAFFAVRGSEMAAASLGIDVVRTKFTAFAVSGAIAAVAGNLIMTHNQVATPDQFDFLRSFLFLAIVVVGGLSSLGGAIAAALLFGSLSFVFFQVQALAGYLDIVSTGLLAAVLLAYPGGLARLPAALIPLTSKILAPLVPAGRMISRVLQGLGNLRRRIGKAIARKPPARPVEVGAFAVEQKISENGRESPDKRELAGERADRTPVIEVQELTVKFGGLVAVSDVSMSVREGEIVGLIGPNGAGKTVTFNSISGIVLPTAGKIRLFGKEVNDLPVHKRAELGLARTFQVVQLFGQLTVFENLLVATHVHNSTNLFSHVVASNRSIRAELDGRDRVREVVAQLGLEDVADRRVADLPFGVLRVTEIGRALVTEFPVIMLDEATSGLDNTETDRLRDLLFYVRDLGITLLLIEHDVRLVTSMSDYMYVLDRGMLISEGTPHEIKSDPAVISAYLGTSGEPSEAAVVS